MCVCVCMYTYHVELIEWKNTITEVKNVLSELNNKTNLTE